MGDLRTLSGHKGVIVVAGLTEKIVNILAPIIGDYLAEARVRASYVILNIDTPSIEDLNKIAQKIEENMARSVGPVAAATLANKIKRLANI